MSRTAVDAAGCFELKSVAGDLELMVAHPGYRGWRVVVPVGWRTQTVVLTPLTARGVYLAREAVGSDEITSAIWDLAASGLINAVAVDVKGDDGLLLYPSRVGLAQAIGADGDPIVSDGRAFVQRLKARGLYVIARLVTFKDTVLVRAHPEWAIGSADTAVPWADASGAFWISPFEREAWPYFAELAAEAIDLGFDEVQFDYVRFPSDGDIAATTYKQDVTAAARVEAISAFLEAMRPYVKQNGGFLSADVFGYTAWAHDDQGIGQRVGALTPSVDYLSPMLYPSSLAYGIPGSDLNPLDQPDQVVCSGLEATRRQMGDTAPAFLRPWLQAFDDYAFDGRAIREDQVRAQIQAADACGARGWLLWNPFNVYSIAAFEAAGR